MNSSDLGENNRSLRLFSERGNWENHVNISIAGEFADSFQGGERVT